MTVPSEFWSTRLISLYSQTYAVSQHQICCKWISWLEICSIRTIYNMVNSSRSAPVSEGSQEATPSLPHPSLYLVTTLPWKPRGATATKARFPTLECWKLLMCSGYSSSVQSLLCFWGGCFWGGWSSLGWAGGRSLWISHSGRAAPCWVVAGLVANQYHAQPHPMSLGTTRDPQGHLQTPTANGCCNPGTGDTRVWIPALKCCPSHTWDG